MKRGIYKLLENYKKKSVLNENIKIYQTDGTRYGYYILITSNDTNPESAARESAKIGAKLNLTKKNKVKWDKSFNPPTYYKDRKTGKFGWGYLIHPSLDKTQTNQLLANLKELVQDYNKQTSTVEDMDTSGLSLNQVEKLSQIVQTIEASSDATMNEEAKENLEKYLTELEEAVENDEVYEFLIKTYEQAKQFQSRNTAWKYSLLNSLTITTSDPTATLSGPEQYWKDRNYEIKPEFKKQGIIITKYGSAKSDIFQKANWFKNHPEEFAQFKKEKGFGANVTFNDYIKKGAYQLAKYATEKKLINNQSRMTFSFAPTYTDNMVQPMEGKEVEPIGSDLYVKEKDVDDKEKLYTLFNALFSIAEKHGISTLGIGKAKDNINDFGKLLNAVSFKSVSDKLKYRLKDKTKQTETQEMFKAYAEIITHIVKKHFGLPSESSKYNIASLGADREAIKKESNTIINIADRLINEIDDVVKKQTNSLNEIKRYIKKTLLKKYVSNE